MKVVHGNYLVINEGTLGILLRLALPLTSEIVEEGAFIIQAQQAAFQKVANNLEAAQLLPMGLEDRLVLELQLLQ